MSNKVDAAQVTKAVAALRKHSEKVKAEGGSKLFDGDDDDDAETYSVMVSTRRVPQRASNKLVPIPLPHPLLSLDVAEVCLIVKDHQGEGHKDAKRKVAEMEKCGVAKVLGISKLRNNYKPHEAKRKLCDSYDLFLADARVLPLLPKLLGKTFFKKKRQPVPVDLTKKDWPTQVRKAAAAYARRGAGTCVSVKVGRAARSQGNRRKRDGRHRRRRRARGGAQVGQRAGRVPENHRVRGPARVQRAAGRGGGRQGEGGGEAARAGARRRAKSAEGRRVRRF